MSPAVADGPPSKNAIIVRLNVRSLCSWGALINILLLLASQAFESCSLLEGSAPPPQQRQLRARDRARRQPGATKGGSPAGAGAGAGTPPPASPPWELPHPVLLLASIPGDVGAPAPAEAFSPRFADEPAILDVFLAEACVVMIAPGYFWDPALDGAMLNVTLRLHGDGDGGIAFAAAEGGTPARQPARGRHISNRRAEKYVSQLLWCAPELATRAAVDATLALNATHSVRTMVRRAPEGPPPAPTTRRATGEPDDGGGVGACTLFREFRSLVPWAQYLRRVGVAGVYATFNGDLAAEARNATAAYRAAQELVAAGFLHLTQWDAPFDFYRPVMQAFGTTKRAAMSACLLRRRHRHAWMLLADDDEYVYVAGAGVGGGGDTAADGATTRLESYLAQRAAAGATGCVLLAHTWAVAGLVPGADFALDALTAPGALRRSPDTQLLARTKYFLHRSSPPVYDTHFTETCEPHRCWRPDMPAYCTDPADAGILHVADVHARHISAPPETWGPTAAWNATAWLTDMVGAGRGATAAVAR